MNSTMKTALQVLKKHFGFDQFLPNQEEIIQAILEGKDALAVMPTGSGKSIIFQLPSLMKEGLTIVVSPLIALMKDQVEGLRLNGINAEYLNSMLGATEIDEILSKLGQGKVDLLYLAPEKLLSGDFITQLDKWNVTLFAIDEAHCISNWGHDFRPEYSQLSQLKEKFPDIPMVALTATADKITRDDIVLQLSLKDPRILVASFDRPNLSLEVLPGVKRFMVIEEFIKKRPDSSGIIYCLSRKSTEELSQKLNEIGIEARHYHAGMQREERNEAQELFIRDEIPVICATIAFGMGIDKSNVRWIIHYNLPKSLENYYQEIGRAGRDGIPSDTLLFYSFRDVMLLREFAENSGQPDIKLEKLQRMQQYAEATSCRRNVLLSYFNEHVEIPCGNCDICQHPPKTFDGTTIAQKALSAIVRLKENVSSGLLIDVLRGSGKREILEQGFQKIKTWGAGREISFFDWQQYLLQMLHQGLFDIAYNDHRKLKVTAIGKKVLFENKKVDFVKPVSYQNRIKSEGTRLKKRSKAEQMKMDLTDLLKEWRKKRAKTENVPPYVIFNDKTIDELAEKRPVFSTELIQISGIGDHKAKKYGKEVMKIMLTFKIDHKDKGSSYLYSKKLLDEGNSINKIAEIRDLNVMTVMQHLISVFEKDLDFPILQHLPPFDVAAMVDFIEEYQKIQGETPPNKLIYDHFKGRFEYHQIRIAQLMVLRDA
jgi:ATP-dependent DNA helicase RecQ